MGDSLSSAVLWRSYAHMAHHFGVFEFIRDDLPADTRAIWVTTSHQPWYPMKHFRALVESLSKLPEHTYEDFSYAITRDRFGPIIGGLLRVAFAISGSSPHTVFKRFPVLVELGLKGLTSSYRATSEHTGEITIGYPEPWPPAAVTGWKGIVRYLYETTGHTDGRVSGTDMPDDRTFIIRLEW